MIKDGETEGSGLGRSAREKCDSLIFLSYLSRDAHPIMRPMDLRITRTTDDTAQCRSNYVEDGIA
jgi:hypothetical protein